MVEVRVTVGRFTLQIGSPHGTRAEPAAEPDATARERLAEALRAPTATGEVADVVGTGVEKLEEVTAAVERANDLVAALAKGLTLDPKALERQADALLDVLDRADHDGRFEEEIRLARALVALLALIPRWVALVEVLRRAASAAAAVGDRAGEAWAKHELGSFALGADDARAATGHLTEALGHRHALGDHPGTEVTLHNLRMVSLVPPPEPPSAGLLASIRRHPVVAALAAVALLAAAGGLAIAARNGGRDEPDAANTTATATAAAPTDPGGGATDPGGGTATGEAPTDGTTTDGGDTVDPSVEIGAPGEFLRGTVTVTATATDGGGSGVERVEFTAALATTEDETNVGRDRSAPYAIAWNTTAVQDGAYVLVALATDRAGNDAESDGATIVVDNTAPKATLGTTGSAETAMTLSAKAEDGEGSGIERVVFQLARLTAGVTLVQGPWEDVAVATEPVSEPEYQASVETDTLQEGDYRVRAVAIDRAGNSTASESGGVTISHAEG